jgi:hypothetical protein
MHVVLEYAWASLTLHPGWLPPAFTGPSALGRLRVHQPPSRTLFAV